MLFPFHAFSTTFDFVLFLHALHATMALSCFCVFPIAVVLHSFTLLYFCRIGIHHYPLTQGRYGLSTIYWVRLAEPICFLSSSFIHYIRLVLLTLLLSFLFIYFVGPHLLGSILFLYFWVFLILILLLKKGLLLLIFILNITLQEEPPITLLPKGVHGPTFGLYFSFSKYSSFLGHHLDFICAFFSL